MRHFKWLSAALFTTSLLISSPASATVTYFTLTGDSNDVSFSIDDASAPFVFDANSFGYMTLVDFNGVPVDLLVSFFDVSLEGGLQIEPFLDLLGPQLFSGPTSDPTFLLGTFALSDSETEAPYSLTISTTAPIPEPSSWAMMIAGLALVGYGLRLSRKPKVVFGSIG